MAIPFILKNAKVTYQRLINKFFHDRIGRSMEVYVDTLLVKSRIVESFISDLKEIFEVLRNSRMMLNIKKSLWS